MFGLDGTLSVFAGAIALGVVHGAEPGHGWPIAAAYALDRERTWLHGLVASTLLGLGHLVSSLAVVAAFFLATDFVGITDLGWIRYVAGVLLIALGIREYRHGHSHDHGASEDHDHDSHDDHSHGEHHDDHEHDDHDNGHMSADSVDSQGLTGIVWTAFVLGFAHEEEFEIIGLCLGSDYCLALMVAYALAVLVALVALTLLLLAGFERYGERVEGLAEYFPTISAVVLIAIGLGFIFGIV